MPVWLISPLDFIASWTTVFINFFNQYPSYRLLVLRFTVLRGFRSHASCTDLFRAHMPWVPLLLSSSSNIDTFLTCASTSSKTSFGCNRALPAWHALSTLSEPQQLTRVFHKVDPVLKYRQTSYLLASSYVCFQHTLASVPLLCTWLSSTASPGFHYIFTMHFCQLDALFFMNLLV